jgi:hypothetical protein
MKGRLLMFRNSSFRKITYILIALTIATIIAGDGYGAKKDKTSEKEATITEAELQSHVMSFADRFAAIMVTALAEFETKTPAKKIRYEVLALITYSISNAYIIAGESDPDVALLDILSMVTLGRIIFEEEGLSKYGDSVQQITQGLLIAENDIRKIAALVLAPDQLAELMSIIESWREENPGLIFYPPIRFSDFAAGRRESRLTKSEGQKGLFKSVEAATEQVEEIRLLAERGMYLATRMPQLSGLYADLWLARLIESPYASGILADISTLSKAADRLAAVAEKLPDKIAKERNATINQAINSIAQERNEAVTQFAAALSTERKATIDAFAAEGERIRGLFADLRQTFESGNEFVESVNALATRFTSVHASDQDKPYDIRDYQRTLSELSNSARELTILAASLERVSDKVAAGQLIPQLVDAMDKAESEGEKLIDHTMHQMILLIVIGLIGYIFARLLIKYFSVKMKAGSKQAN